MRKLLQSTLLIVLGFTLGVVIMSYLSMRASISLLEIVRLNYLMEQRIMAVRAKKDGNIDSAVMYYANLVSTSSSPGLYSFSKTRQYWPMSFPIVSPVLERINNTTQNKESKKREEGIYRGMFADALEKAGRSEEAMLQYIKASRLLGYDDDITRVKKLIKEVMLSDDELLKLQDQYVHPQNFR